MAIPNKFRGFVNRRNKIITEFGKIDDLMNTIMADYVNLTEMLPELNIWKKNH